MTIPIPERRANDDRVVGEASLTNGFGSFIPAESPWTRRVVSSVVWSRFLFPPIAAAHA